MENVRILIVEDEFLIAQDLSMRLEQKGYSIANIVDTAEDAIACLKQEPVDICILDINIHGPVDGVGLAHQINALRTMPLIFLTSHTDSLTIARARDAKPAAYMLKPFNDVELGIAIDLAVANFATGQTAKPEEDEKPSDEDVFILNESIFIKKKERFKRVKFDDILWVEAQSNYSLIVTAEEKFVMATTLGIVEEKLTGPAFFRVSRSSLVNLKQVDELEGNMVVVQGTAISVSKNKKEALYRRFNIL